MIHNDYLLVESILTADERDAITEAVTGRNAHLSGAPVADLLDITEDADGAITWTEPFWMELERQQGLQGDNRYDDKFQSVDDGALYALCVLAAALIHSRTPTEVEADELYKRADTKRRADGS